MLSLEQYYKQLENDISETNGVIKSKKDNISKSQANLLKLNTKREENLEKKLILQEACKKARELSSDLFATVSTNGVKTILGDNLDVKIVSGDKNGVPTADFVVHARYHDYETVTNPAEEDGGGVADVVSLTNFLSMNILNSNTNKASIILDEPTKFVSAGHANDVGVFLRKISEDFDKQIILVTHASETKNHANKIFHVSLDENGTSKVETEKMED